MSRRAIVTHATDEAAFDDAALQISTLVDGAITRRGRALVVLTGGTTVPAVYERLATGIGDRDVAWKRIVFFFSDERCVPPDHADSNYGMAFGTLLEPLGIDPGRVIRMRGEERDRQRAAAAYEARIREVMGEGAPLFDVLLLGMGADGHVASLVPGHPLLAERSRWTGVVEAADLGAVTPAVDRLTLTPPALHAARETIVLAVGAAKAAAVGAALGEGGDANATPARLVHGPQTKVTWLLDEASAAHTAARA